MIVASTWYLPPGGEEEFADFFTGEIAPRLRDSGGNVLATFVSETRANTYPRLPVLRLARLAVDERVQGQGISRLLLKDVVALAHRMKEDMGCVGLVVDAKREAVAYHRKIGFVDLKAFAGELADKPLPLPMFLELEAIPKRR